MRYLILIMTILTLLSCNLSNKSSNKKDSNNATLQKAHLDSISKILIGEWGIYSKVTNSSHDRVIEEMSTNCNVCPKIVFHIDKTAIVKNPSGPEEQLSWKVNEDKLIIISKSKIESDRTFSDTDFIMTFTKDNKFFILKLTQIKNKYSYILRR